MKKYIKNIGIFLLIFIAAFFAIHVFGFLNCYGDPNNSYGFAKAISMGQIPYRDFNTIATPLYAMYQSLFLHLYDDFIMINISQAILITVTCALLYDIFGKKSWLLLIIVALFQYKNLVATYNFMSVFMIVLLVYMEKKHSDKDFLIGIFLALSVLAKQTVGCFMLIPSIVFYIKDIRKLLKRFCGFLVPCFLFLIYLLVNKCLYEFFDLCLFGLFDFLNSNGVGGGHINYFWLILSVLTFIIGVFILVKNKNEISNYYFICGVLIVFPLFDITHFSFWLTCFGMMLLPYIRKYEKYFVTLCVSCSVCLCLLVFFSWIIKYDVCITKDFNHYGYNLHMKNNYINLKKMKNLFDRYEDPIILGYQSMFYTIENNKEFSYFNILYDGNYGYNGIEKMRKKIDGMHDQIFIISVFDYENDDEFSQISKSLIKYVMDNSKKLDEESGFWIYYKE